MLEKIKILDKQTKIIAIATVLCILVTLGMSFNTIKYYTQKKITVSAKITQMHEYDRSNEDTNDTGYDVYIDYACLGKTYKDVYYTAVPLNTELSVGNKINVEVYADDPGKIATDTFVSIWFFLAGSVVLSVISVKKIKKELSQDNA